MMIDPVILLVEELRAARPADGAAQPPSGKETDAAWAMLHSALDSLYGRLLETVPTSALGAGELVRVIAHRLGLYPDHARCFHEVAGRLGAGERRLGDLIWLRAMRTRMADGACGEQGKSALPFLDLALLGASRPVLVFRAVMRRREPEKTVRL